MHPSDAAQEKYQEAPQGNKRQPPLPEMIEARSLLSAITLARLRRQPLEAVLMTEPINERLRYGSRLSPTDSEVRHGPTLRREAPEPDGKFFNPATGR